MLLNGTINTLDLASSYWSLRGKDVYKHPSDWEGEWIYSAIKSGVYTVLFILFSLLCVVQFLLVWISN